MYKPFSRWHHGATLVLLLLAILASIAAVPAQTAVPTTPPNPDEASRRAAYIQAFLADQKPPEELAPLAAVNCVGGMADIYPCENVDLLAFMPLATIGGGNGNDIWGWTDPLTNKEYALMGRTTGTAFVDISDPENPVYLGNLPTHTNSSTWRDIKVYNNYAFIVSEASGHGMQVFDLTLLRNVVNPPVTFSNSAHYNQFGNAHNIVINEDSGFAYAVGTGTCSGGLHMVNIQNPLLPTNAGCFSADGYTHDAQCVIYTGPDVTHQGKEICFNSNEDTLTIADVTVKNSPVQLARIGYSGSAYSHQGWLTEDQTYFLLDDELDEQNSGHNTRTYIWDVSNLDLPVLIDTYDSPVAAIDHNMYVKDGHVFQSNYRGGLRILSAQDVANGNLSEVAYFDIYPSSNSASFNGTWSNYPYYASGVVVVSGIEQGLFILRPNLAPDFGMSATPPSNNVCQGQDAVYNISISSLFSFSQPVSLTVASLPANATSTFGTNPVNPPGSSSLTIGTTGVAEGSYPLDVVGTAATSTHTTTVQLSVVSAAPTAPTLSTPANGATGQSVSPMLVWQAIPGASSYDVELATDMAFGNIIFTDTVAATSTAVAGLGASTTYYWRVSATNGCGTGNDSAVFSFTTAALYCSTPAAPLPDDPDQAFNLVINDTGELADLNISILAAHTYVGDTIFTLVHQDTGTSVTIIDRPGYTGAGFGCANNNIDVMLDDEGMDGPVENQCASDPALFGNPTPNNLLSAFDGEDLSGTWILQYSDEAGGDTGTLNEWCLVPQLVVPVESGYLTGVVTDSSTSNPISGATITADNGTNTYNFPTNGSGVYTDTLPTGTYTVTASAAGYLSDTVTAVAITLDATTTADFALDLIFVPVYGLSHTGDITGSATAGETITYSVSLTNTGNTTDTFDMGVASVWSAQPSTTQVTLAAGESATMTVVVTVPIDAGGTADTATVTITSQGDGAVSGTIDLTTTAVAPPTSQWNLFLPLITK